MLEKVKKGLGKIMSYKYFLLILLLSSIFIVASLYIYKKFVIPRISPEYVANKEFIGGEEDVEVAEIYFFYTTWCPHCKKAMPIWKNLKDEVGDNSINGVRINFLEVDCDEDTSVADKFNVTGYPTIKLVKGNQTIEYDAKPDKDNLLEFLRTSL